MAQGLENSSLIYTAGSEGAIKIWKVPRPEDITIYGDCDISINCNKGAFQRSDKVIWDLKHHPTKVQNIKLLLI
jgi:hypothetical protein